MKNRGQGICQLATGTGKTVTALSLLQRLYKNTIVQIAVVVVPYRHLVDQWCAEADRFGLRTIPCYDSVNSWLRPAFKAARNTTSATSLPVLVVTNATFRGERFGKLLSDLKGKNAVLVADEVHNFGAPHLRDSLPTHVSLRLGLSATPERFMDPEGTESIFNYFGSTLEPIVTVRDAIDMDALTAYTYDVHPVRLTEDEFESYGDLTQRIIQAYGKRIEAEGEEETAAKFLLMKRARIVAGAAEKPDALFTLIRPNARELRHALIYTGEARISDDPDMDRQIDHVVSVLGNTMNLRVASFTAKTERNKRRQLLVDLDSGDLQALVAMRCLDEGVDVPTVHTAFILSSSRNPRQYVQRRGRVLRRAPGKISAAIHDFLTLPPISLSRLDTGWSIARELVRRELERARVFCLDATNGQRSWHALHDLRAQYDLTSL